MYFWTDVLAFHIQLVDVDIPSIFRVIYFSKGPSNAPHKINNGKGHVEGITLMVSCCLRSSYIALKVGSGCGAQARCMGPVCPTPRWLKSSSGGPEEKGGHSH